MSHDHFSVRRPLLLGGPLAALVAAIVGASASCGQLNSGGGDVDSGVGTSGNPSGSGGSSSGSASNSGSSSGSGMMSSGGPSSSGTGPGSSGSSSSSSGGGEVVVEAGAGDATVAKMMCSDSTEQLPYTDGIGLDISSATGYKADPTVATKAQQIVSGMSVKQLADQMRGTPPMSGNMTQFNDIYRTVDDTTAMVKGFEFRDGPRGVCLLQPQFTGVAQNATTIAYGNGYSTVFPVPSARAATWDLDLEYTVGKDTGDEILATGNTMVFAPVVNILRHPAWGRSQETYGEDTFQLGRMGSAYVEGVQQFVPACVKHYLAYNIEKGRQNLNSQLDDQTLHEIYGRHFEMIVQEAGVACVMASYNSVNGTKATLDGAVLTDMLRTKFGFKGFILSDFWAMPPFQSIQTAAQQQTIATQGLAAGLDMELPWSLNYSQLETVVGTNTAMLKPSATRIIEQKLRFNVLTPGSTNNLGLQKSTSTLTANGVTNMQHLADAEQVALEGMVLLKNDNNTLPIPSTVHNIAVIGAVESWTLSDGSGTDHFATDPRLGDFGSSRVTSDPAQMVGPFAGIQAAAPSGVTVTNGTTAADAANADFIVAVTGLTQEDEGEDYTNASDRADNNGNALLDLDPKANQGTQNNLVMSLAALGKPMVVVNESGSVVNLPWLKSVPAFIQAWYPGARGGAALGHLLFGTANFSGKLPVTWPNSAADLPQFNTGPANGGTTVMDYYLGYRYYDNKKMTPLFAFGAGMSYTQFKYQFLGVPCSTVTKKGVVDVAVQVTNTGTVPGNEVTFLFVSYPNTTARRSVKELKGFHRTSQPIMPGQTVQFTIPLRIQDLKYWPNGSTDWVIDSGPVKIMVGGSSDNLPLSDTVTVM